MNILLRIASSVLLICGMFLHSAFATDLATVTDHMQNAYSNMQSFSADFTQKLLQRESGVTETRKGTLLFKKPLLVRWETAAPHTELLLVTDKEIWNYLPDEELAYRYSRQLAEDSRSLIQVITGQSALTRDFDVENAQSSEDSNLIHLLLYPKEPTPELTEAQIWVSPDTFIIQKAMVMDFYGNTNTVELSHLKKNVSVASSDFQFSPPKGIEVEDHLDSTHPVARPLLN